MTRAGPVRSRKVERSTPYSRPQAKQAVQQQPEQGPTLFSKVRNFLFGYRHPEQEPASPRVPRVVPTQLEVTQDSIVPSTEEAAFASGYVSGLANASSSPIMPGGYDSPLRAGSRIITSSPYVSRHQSFANASGPELAGASWVSIARSEDPNETLRRFFEEKGDRELSVIEIEGVNSLIDQAAARGESMINLDTLQPSDSFSADRTQTILVASDGASTPTAASESHLWSPRRRSLAAGPKIDRTASESPNGSFRYPSKPFRHQEPSVEHIRPRSTQTSATANALLEILNKDKPVPEDLTGLVDADTISGFKPRRRQVGKVPSVLATSTPEPAQSVPSKATQVPAPHIPDVLSASRPVKPTHAELDAKISNLKALAQGAPTAGLKDATLIFCDAAKASSRIIELGPEAAEPQANSAAYKHLMQPIRDATEKVDDLLDENHAVHDQLRALSEASRVFAWTSLKTPAQYIQSVKTSAAFFAKRVLANQPGHDLVEEVVAFLSALELYVSSDYKNGFKWTGSTPLSDVVAAESSLPALATPYSKHKPVRPSSLRRSIAPVEHSDSEEVIDLLSDEDDQDTTLKTAPKSERQPELNVPKPDPKPESKSQPFKINPTPFKQPEEPATPEPLYDPGAPSHISSSASTPAPVAAEPAPALPAPFVLGKPFGLATAQKSTDTIPDFAFPAPPAASGPAILSPAEETTIKSFEDEFIF